MPTEVVATLDIGTSSVRASLYDSTGQAVPGAFHKRTHKPHTSEDGESTLDADTVVKSAIACLVKVMRHPDIKVLAVGMDTFWHSTLGVDESGQACTPIYLWNDTRSGPQVDELRRRLDERAVHARTGCRFHTSYLPARLLWLSQHQPDLMRNVRSWMSPGEYVYWQLFGDRRCSISMASATGLLNQDRMEWDTEILKAIGLPASTLASLADLEEPASGLKMPWSRTLPSLANVPWYLPLGDGACSNVGSGGIDPGLVTLMVGTSGAMRLMGDLPQPAPWGLWKYRLDRKRVLIGGALSNGGAVYEWLRHTYKLPRADALESYLQKAEPDSHGLTVLPFLSGERSPDWYSRATGSILGLTAATTPEQVFQASLEAVAYRFAMVHRLLAPLAVPDHLLVGSGKALSDSPAWAQVMVDAINRPMVVPAEGEGSSRGVALLVLQQLGILKKLPAVDTTGLPLLQPDSTRRATYAHAIKRHQECAARLNG